MFQTLTSFCHCFSVLCKIVGFSWCSLRSFGQSGRHLTFAFQFESRLQRFCTAFVKAKRYAAKFTFLHKRTAKNLIFGVILPFCVSFVGMLVRVFPMRRIFELDYYYVVDDKLLFCPNHKQVAIFVRRNAFSVAVALKIFFVNHNSLPFSVA